MTIILTAAGVYFLGLLLVSMWVGYHVRPTIFTGRFWDMVLWPIALPLNLVILAGVRIGMRISGRFR